LVANRVVLCVEPSGDRPSAIGWVSYFAQLSILDNFDVPRTVGSKHGALASRPLDSTLDRQYCCLLCVFVFVNRLVCLCIL